LFPTGTVSNKGNLGSFGHDMLTNCQQMVTRQGKFCQHLTKFPCFDLKNLDYKPSGSDKTLRQVIMDSTVRIPIEPKANENNKQTKKEGKNKKENKPDNAVLQNHEGTANNKEPPSNNDAMGVEAGKKSDKDSNNNEHEANSKTPDNMIACNYTEEKLFYCIMPCNKGKAAIFISPKEYIVSAMVMIMGLILHTKHLYGDETKTWFGWSALGREDSDDIFSNAMLPILANHPKNSDPTPVSGESPDIVLTIEGKSNAKPSPSESRKSYDNIDRHVIYGHFFGHASRHPFVLDLSRDNAPDLLSNTNSTIHE